MKGMILSICLVLMAGLGSGFTSEQQIMLDGMNLSYELGMAYEKALQGQNVAEYNALVEEYNRKLGVTRAQEEAMKGGSMFGFDKPIADPANYDAQGQPLKRREKDRGDAR